VSSALVGGGDSSEEIGDGDNEEQSKLELILIGEAIKGSSDSEGDELVLLNLEREEIRSSDNEELDGL